MEGKGEDDLAAAAASVFVLNRQNNKVCVNRFLSVEDDLKSLPDEAKLVPEEEEKAKNCDARQS